MAFRRKHRAGKTGGNPGLTPIDVIHREERVVDLDPDSDTGRLPSQGETDERGTKRQRLSGKSGSKKTS